MLSFPDRLDAAVRRCRNPVLVGLDPRADMLPPGLLAEGAAAGRRSGRFRAYCHGIIDVVAPLVPAVKPQAAFFEQSGRRAWPSWPR